jgi:hypothetical protein
MACSLVGVYQAGFSPKGEGSVFLGHIGNHLQDSTMQQLRRPQLVHYVTMEPFMANCTHCKIFYNILTFWKKFPGF